MNSPALMRPRAGGRGPADVSLPFPDGHGARAGNPHAPHAQGLWAAGGARAGHHRARRARAMGSQPPSHQPVALPRARRREQGAPDGARGGRESGLRRQAPACADAGRGQRAAAGSAAEEREDLLATGVAAYVVLLGAHARGLAAYWRTVPLLDDSRARGSCSGSRTARARSGCCISALRCSSSARRSGRPSRRSSPSCPEPAAGAARRTRSPPRGLMARCAR